MNDLLNFVFKSWSIDQLVPIPYEIRKQYNGARHTYYLRLWPPRSSCERGEHHRTISIAMGQFEPNVPLVFHVDERKELICIDTSFVEMVELYTLAYYIDSMVVDGITVHDTDIYICVFLLTSRGTPLEGDRLSALRERYALKLRALQSFISKRHMLSAFVPTVLPTTGFSVSEAHRILALHEISHIVSNKWRAWFREERTFLNVEIRDRLRYQQRRMRSKKMFRLADYGFLQESRKFWRETPPDSPTFTEVFCDFLSAKLKVSSECQMLSDGQRFESAYFAAASIWDGLLKVTSGLSVGAREIYQTSKPRVFRAKWQRMNFEYAIRHLAQYLGFWTAAADERLVDWQGKRARAAELLDGLNRAQRRFVSKRDKLFWWEFVELSDPDDQAWARKIASKVSTA